MDIDYILALNPNDFGYNSRKNNSSIIKRHSTQFVTAGLDLGPGQRKPARQSGAYGWQPGAIIRIRINFILPK